MSEQPFNNFLVKLVDEMRRSEAVRVTQRAVDALALTHAAANARILEVQRQIAASPAANLISDAARWSEQNAQRVRDMQRQVATSPAAAWTAEAARWTEETAQKARRYVEDLNRRYPDLHRQVAKVAANARRLMSWGLAPNWMHMAGEDLEATITLMDDAQVNLAWAPEPEILEELLAAGASGVDTVLAARADEIVAQLLEVLTAVDDPALASLADATREALETHEAGKPRAAQALATAVIGGIVHDLLGHSKITKAHNKYRKLDPEKSEFYEVRHHAIYRCLGAACAGDNAPSTGFHRNRAAHRVDPAQYTAANAVRSLLLIVGILREEQFWFDEASAEDAVA